MRKNDSARLLSLLGAGALLVACGDNKRLTDGDDVPDMGDDTPDMGGDIDMAGGGPTVGSTVAVSDVTVTTEEAAAAGFRGGSISISFSDLTMGGGDPIFVEADGAPIQSCLIQQFDATHTPNPLLDGGTVTITNEPASEAPATGLLKTVGPCNALAPLGNTYLCISGAGMDSTVTAADIAGSPPANVVAYTITGADFTGQDLVGSYLQINGFTTATYNSGASAFPIMAVSPPNTIVALNNAASGATPEADVTTIDYTILNGFAPIPQPQAPFDNDFLGTGSVRISKPAADGVWPAVDEVVDVRGQGWTLDSVSDDPDGFPTATAVALRYGCDNDNADAGDDTCGDESATLVQAIIISGRATRKDLTGLQPFQMPTEVPGTDTWLEWQCAFIGFKEADMPVEAVQEIIDFAPTRVEQRILLVAGAIIMDGDNTLRLLVGHGFVGHTTFPAAAN